MKRKEYVKLRMSHNPMRLKEFEDILRDSGDGDILSDESWAEDYPPEIHFTVKELRRIAVSLFEREKGVSVGRK